MHVAAAPPLSCDSRALRDCLGCFATGVVVVTALNADGRPAGLTVNSFSSVSLDPPLVLWSLRRDSRILSAFQASPGFIINVLAANQTDVSSRFAGRFNGERYENWQNVVWDRGLYGIPRLVGVHAALECEKHARHQGGDHVIFVGRVVGISVNAEASPLVYYRGRYAGIST